MLGLRRAGVLLLWTIAVAFVFASAGSSGVAAPPPAADLNPILYPGTLRPASTCANPKRCTHAVITFTNPEKFALNSFMIGIKDDPSKSVKLNGDPACTANGGKYGPDFKNGWLCLGLNVKPGETITGVLIATEPLTPTSSARFDWSNKGSAAGMLPDYSHDIPYYWIPAAAPAPPTPAAKAVELITEAIAKENEALKKLDKIRPNTDHETELGLRNTAVDDLRGSVTELQEAGHALGSVSDSAEVAMRLDHVAIGHIRDDKDTSRPINEIVHALGAKRTGLAIAQKAATKK